MTISELFVGHKFFSLSVSQSVSLLAGSQSIDMLARVSQSVRQSDSLSVGQVVSWSFSQVVVGQAVGQSVGQLIN